MLLRGGGRRRQHAVHSRTLARKPAVLIPCLPTYLRCRASEAAKRPMRQPFLTALAVRVACALAIATAFAPDEYWQSLEVAHRLVFG